MEQLGNETLDVRLGGIYALERIARESRTDHGPIVEILSAFVRDHAPRLEGVNAASAGLDGPPVESAAGRGANEAKSVNTRPSADVQAVLTVLGRRNVPPDPKNKLQLQDTDLSGAMLPSANLKFALFPRANLAGAVFTDANLVNADL